MRGYEKLASAVLATSIQSANLLESDSPEVATTAIMDIEFLGSSTAEAYFVLSGYEQQWGLERIDYRHKVTRALERLREDDIHIALTQKCRDIVRPMVHPKGATRGGRPHPLVAEVGRLRLEKLRRNLEWAKQSSTWPYSSS